MTGICIKKTRKHSSRMLASCLPTIPWSHVKGGVGMYTHPWYTHPSGIPTPSDIPTPWYTYPPGIATPSDIPTPWYTHPLWYTHSLWYIYTCPLVYPPPVYPPSSVPTPLWYTCHLWYTQTPWKGPGTRHAHPLEGTWDQACTHLQKGLRQGMNTLTL